MASSPGNHGNKAVAKQKSRLKVKDNSDGVSVASPPSRGVWEALRRASLRFSGAT